MNNSGLSLVELIVAFAIGIIVAGSVASIVFISTRMYSRGTSNISGQYEIQTTLNQTVDSAESAQWLAYSSRFNEGNKVINTDYVAFGRIFKEGTGYFFEGEIFTDNYDDMVDGKFNVYMNRYKKLAIAAPAANGLVEEKAVSAVSDAADDIRGEKKYLLGEDATRYAVFIDASYLDATTGRFKDYPAAPAEAPSEESEEETETPASVKGSYENPIVLSVEIDFSKKSMTGEVKKHVQDKVTLRNHLKSVLYIQERDGYYEPAK